MSPDFTARLRRTRQFVAALEADIGVVAPTGAKVGDTPRLTHDGTELSIPLSESSRTR